MITKIVNFKLSNSHLCQCAAWLNIIKTEGSYTKHKIIHQVKKRDNSSHMQNSRFLARLKYKKIDKWFATSFLLQEIRTL